MAVPMLQILKFEITNQIAQTTGRRLSAHTNILKSEETTKVCMVIDQNVEKGCSSNSRLSGLEYKLF